MTAYMLLRSVETGHIAPFDYWRWHGDGQHLLEEIELIGNGGRFLTNRVFPGWFGDAYCGDSYIAEWGEYATDKCSQKYLILFHFQQTKACEQEPDMLSWDEEHIYSVRGR